jgi:DHA1 family bicyclomycin/chloramphenicol resistance-like MFS transporter
MLKPDTFALTVLLAALTALAPLSTDLYLPTLPDLARAFGVSPAQVQLTLSAYLVGFAIGQIAYGPISDWYGRRSGFLVALACYCVGSLICLFAPSIEVLISARVLQAFGGSGAIVLARAVVRDLYSGARAGKELSLMGLVMAFGPVSAPLIGGVLHTFFGWRASFAALLLFGLGLMATVLRKMPETLGERPADPASLRSMLSSYREMLRNRDFVIYLSICVGAYTGVLCWLSGAPFVLQSLLGLSPLVFSITFSIGSIGYLLGTMIATRIVSRAGIVRVIGYGALLMVLGGLAMCASIALGLASANILVAAMSIWLIGLGLVFPQALAGGLSCFADRAGAASSLLGFSPQLVAAAAGSLVVAMVGKSAWPLAIAVLTAATAVLLLSLSLRRPVRA